MIVRRLIRVAGKPGLRLAVRLDLLRDLGLRYARQRMQADALLAASVEGSTRRVYQRIWRDAAAELGAAVEELPYGFTKIVADGRSTIVWQRMVMLDDAVTLKLATEKNFVQTVLRDARLPVPESAVFSWRELERALEFLRSANGPCVVKPASGGAGLATTGQIEQPEHLLRAALRAASPEAPMLIQRQIHGDVFRLLICDGEVLGVVRRVRPRVVGDGKTPIGDLIRAENQRRLQGRGEEGIPLLRVDLDCLLTLAQGDLSLRSVVPPGVDVAVKTVTNQNSPRDNFTARDIAQGLMDEAVAATEAVGLRLAGVDIVTPDVQRPLHAAGGAIIEVNGNPGLHHHYHVADPSDASRVAIPILRKLLKQSGRRHV